MSSNTSPPRLSHIVRVPDFNGYGFNLHTIKNKTGQYIGQVDNDSPAERALLKEGDKIIEVNGVNIASENHKQVVTRIKLVPNETTLLVVDENGETWYRDHNIVITGDLPEVVKASSATRRLSTSSSEVSVASASDSSNRQDTKQAVVADAVDAGSSEDNKSAPAETDKEEFFSKTETGSNKCNTSMISDDEDDDAIAKELITNGKRDDEDDKIEEKLHHEEETIVKIVVESESEDETLSKKNEKNAEEPSLKDMVQENVATKRESDDDSNSCKSRSNGSRRSIASASSASSRGSGATNSRGTDPVADKSPMSTSPSPPSSVGAPSPTPAAAPPNPTFNSKNMDGLNLNMTAAEMRALLASKKKKDIRHNTDMDLRKKYEIIQRL